MAISATKAVACASIAVGLSAAVSEAALYANESFDYTAGAAGDGSLITQSPGNGFGSNAWTAHLGATPAAVVSGSLAPGTGVYSVGNKATINQGSGRRAMIALDTSSGGNFASVLDGSSNIGLDNTSIYISYIFVSNDPKNEQGLELYRDGGRALFLGSKDVHSYTANARLLGPTLSHLATFGGMGKNATRQFVLKIDFLPGNDQVTGWFNPETTGTPTPSFTSTVIGDASFDSIAIWSSASTPTLSFDEIRIGQSFSDVVSTSAGTFVPEPATLGLVGLLGLAARRRRSPCTHA